MTTSRPTPDDGPDVPAPGVDAVPTLDQDDSGGAKHASREVPSDAERMGTAEDEADAARRHSGA